MTKYFFFLIVVTTSFYSCRQTSDNKNNDTTTISTDTAILGQLLDLKLVKPTKVKFKYIFIDNSGQNQRVTVPGPSDSYLEAVIFYDAVTFRKLTETCNPDYMQYLEPGYDSPNYNREQFNFDWLDKNVKDELLQSDTNYHGDFDKYYGSRGKLWLLDNKVLIIKSTN